MANITMLQGFEWFTENDGEHWNRLAQQAVLLKKIGIKRIWLPPAMKGSKGADDVGYSIYDRYDLGEFDQHGLVRTKYGTKDQYLACIQELQNNDIKVIADIVLNHMDGADGTEDVEAIKYDKKDRTNPEDSKAVTIRAYTKFDYPNRHGKYSADTWNHDDFNGVDYDENTKEKDKAYLFKGKRWNPDVDWGDPDYAITNFDFLMSSNIDFENPLTRDKLLRWGEWYLETTGVDGFRLDAVKHISHKFMPMWVQAMRLKKGDKFFTVGEYLSYNKNRLFNYLDEVISEYYLFDFPLHDALQKASNYTDTKFDMRGLFSDSLLYARPRKAVTFVDNHDTQNGAGPCASPVKDWFKKHAYALVLFQKNGIPCVFFSDLFGYKNDNEQKAVDDLAKMIRIRLSCAHGSQTDYYDDPCCIGYTRGGADSNYKYSGMAIMAAVDGGTEENVREYVKEMYVNVRLKNRIFVNIFDPENHSAEVKLNEHGNGIFTIKGATVGVWILKEAYESLKKDPFYNCNPADEWQKLLRKNNSTGTIL